MRFEFNYFDIIYENNANGVEECKVYENIQKYTKMTNDYSLDIFTKKR